MCVLKHVLLSGYAPSNVIQRIQKETLNLIVYAPSPDSVPAKFCSRF